VGRGMTRVLLALLLVGNAANAGSQGRAAVRGTEIRQGPVYVTDRVIFQLNDMSIEQATQMPVRLRVDNPAPSTPYATIPPPLNCVRVTATSSLCDGPLPQATVNQLNVPGRRELYAYAFDGNCCESGPSMVFVIQGRRP